MSGGIPPTESRRAIRAGVDLGRPPSGRTHPVIGTPAAGLEGGLEDEAVAADRCTSGSAAAWRPRRKRSCGSRRLVRGEVRDPSGIAVGAGSVWVANSLSGTVSRIDPGTDSVTKTIPVGGAPHSVAVAGGRVWVSVQEAAPRPSPSGGSTVGAWSRGGPRDDQSARAVRRAAPPRDLRTTHDLREPQRLDGAGLVPELATAPPTVSADGRVYTFRIRPGYRRAARVARSAVAG